MLEECPSFLVWYCVVHDWWNSRSWVRRLVWVVGLDHGWPSPMMHTRVACRPLVHHDCSSACWVGHHPRTRVLANSFGIEFVCVLLSIRKIADGWLAPLRWLRTMSARGVLRPQDLPAAARRAGSRNVGDGCAHSHIALCPDIVPQAFCNNEWRWPSASGVGPTRSGLTWWLCCRGAAAVSRATGGRSCFRPPCIAYGFPCARAARGGAAAGRRRPAPGCWIGPGGLRRVGWPRRRPVQVL